MCDPWDSPGKEKMKFLFLLPFGRVVRNRTFIYKGLTYMQYYFKRFFVLHSSEVIFSFLIISIRFVEIFLTLSMKTVQVHLIIGTKAIYNSKFNIQSIREILWRKFKKKQLLPTPRNPLFSYRIPSPLRAYLLFVWKRINKTSHI